MGLLRHLNFSRAVILLAFVGSAVFGYLVYAQEQRLAEIEGVLRTAPMRMQALQAKALELDELVRQAASEGLGRQENPDDYIRTVARDPQVGVGAVDVAPSEASPLRGVRDNKFKIDPKKGDKPSFSLSQIANYMYMLERESRRVRVTSVTITPVTPKRLKPHEVLPDAWNFSLEITAREKVAQ